MKRFTQSEGGSPGAPEMSFLCEMHINEFIDNVAELLHALDSMEPKRGMTAGRVDDLHWAVAFEVMTDVTKLA